MDDFTHPWLVHRNRQSADLEAEISALSAKLQSLRIQAEKALSGTIGHHDARRALEACEARYRAIAKELRRRRRK